MGNSFNLLTEKWIPVIRNNGRAEKVGIREALEESGQIRQIAASNPMDRVAILRFLLAVLYWCKGNPQGSDKTATGGLSREWFSRLETDGDYFNLLGDGPRFYQDRKAGRCRAVTDLIQEIPTGNNFWHFRHSTDTREGLCPSCCAIGLLRLPLFSVSGLPDLKAGINGTPPIYVVPWRASLLETLRANWLPRAEIGEPAWTNPRLRPARGCAVPVLTGLTLLSRRVWLHDPSEPRGPCVLCGTQEEALVRTCQFESAGEEQNDYWDDPHVIYTSEGPRKAAKAADLTRAGKFVMDRPWPALLGHIIETGKFAFGNRLARFLVVAFATDKAKNVDVWERILEIPPSETIQGTTVTILQKWRDEGGRLASKLRPVSEKNPRREHPEIPPLLVAIRPDVEDRVSAKGAELLTGANNTWERAAKEYRPMMAVIAKSLSPGFTASTVDRRRRIARAIPDMRLEMERRKKGGEE